MENETAKKTLMAEAIRIIVLAAVLAIMLALTCIAAFASDGVISISYTSVKPYEIIENDDSHGYWTTDGANKDYFHYQPEFQLGDKLTVTTAEGSKTYTYQYVAGQSEYYFVNGPDMISRYEVNVDDDQYDNHWVLGGSYTFNVTYKECSCTVPVKIVESPIISISYEPVNQGIYYLDDPDPYKSYVMKDSYNKDFRYYEVYPDIGDRLVVTTTEGSKTYEYNYPDDSSECVYICDKDIIRYGDLRLIHDQFNNHWKEGENDLSASYLGRRYDIKAKLMYTPVKALSFKQKTPYVAVEENGDNGNFDYDSLGKQYFSYWWCGFNDGDQLTVTTDEGTKTYTYVWYDETKGITVDAFICGSERIPLSRLDWWDDQSENHWTPGEHSFSVGYNGAVCNVPVTILTKEEGAARAEAEEKAKSAAADAANSAIDKANNIDPNKCDYDAYIAMFDAKGELEGLLSGGTATAEEIAAATKKLIDAILATGAAGKDAEDQIAPDGTWKKANPMTVKYKKTKSFKAAKLKKKAASFKCATVKNAKGKVAYKAKLSKKVRKALKFNKKNGKITVKKGARKGKYTITVTISAAGNAEYMKAAKKIKITVKVK